MTTLDKSSFSQPEGLTLPLRVKDDVVIDATGKAVCFVPRSWQSGIPELAAYLVSCVNQMQNEGDLFRRLSDALTGGNASTWDEVIHAASSVNQMQETKGNTPDLETLVQEHVERLLSKHSYGQHDDDERIWQIDREDLTTWMRELAFAVVSCVNAQQEQERCPECGRPNAECESLPCYHKPAVLPVLGHREGWRPIAEAPKDGTVIIGYDPDKDDDDGLPHGVDFMRWHEGRWIDPLTHGVSPTHFQPLPDPPSSQRSE